MRLAIPLAAAAVVLTGATALVAFPRLLRADESTHDAVEKLMPQLLSDDDVVRSDAEKKLFGMGEPGRAEIERMTRDSDARRAVTALRLLQSRKWTKTPTAPGEQRVHKDDSSALGNEDPFQRLDDLQERVNRQVEEMRRRFEGRGFAWSTPNVEIQGGPVHGSSSGSIVENDKKIEWTIGEDGHVKVTVKDGKDAPEQTFEAKNFEELKKDHPEAAKRIESMLDGSDRRTFVLRWPKDSMTPQEFLDHGRLPPLDAAPPTQVLGVEWSPPTDVLREQLDLASGGMVVESVVKGSLAEKLGLARFDVLVEVQGKQVAGSADVRAALADAKSGDAVKAVVVRKGQKKTLETTK